MAARQAEMLFDLPESDLAEILAETGADWQALRGRRLFITGGTGFFGKWLLGALAYADSAMDLHLDLTILSRDPARFLRQYPAAARHRALHFQAGDIVGFSPAAERYDFILHAATDTLAIDTAAQEEERSQAIVEGTRRMLELTRRSGARRLLYISSGAVYGHAAAQPTGAAEDDYASATPTTPYAGAKREAEELCAASGLDFVTARAFAFLGPHLPLDAHYAAGNFLRDAHRGNSILVRGDGTALRSYLYPSDLVVWLLRVLLRGRPSRAYNVGSDEKVTTADLARRIAAACRPPPKVTIQSLQPHGPQNTYIPYIARARAELDLQIRVPLDDAILRTFAFLAPQRS